MPSFVIPGSSITHYECAYYSNAVYQPNLDAPLLSGWSWYGGERDKFEYCKNPDGGGFCTIALAKNNEILIVTRGTINGSKDLWQDFQIFIGSTTLYYNEAVKFVNNVTSTKMSQFVIKGFTGHSLGGYISEQLSAKFLGTQAVTFDSPGLPDNLVNQIIKSNPNFANNVATYNSAPNIINALYPHYGKTYRLYPDYKVNSGGLLDGLPDFSLQQHSIADLLAQFSNITFIPNIYGNMSSLWDTAWLSSFKSSSDYRIVNLIKNLVKAADAAFSNTPLQQKFYLNYNANPYYWEQNFDANNLNTAARYNSIVANYKGIDKSSLNDVGVLISGSNTISKAIWGSTNYADIINSTVNNDVVYLFSGNDNIFDPVGNDQYQFFLHNMRGNHTIYDQDGKGSLFFANIGCSVGKIIPLDGSYIFEPKNYDACKSGIEENSDGVTNLNWWRCYNKNIALYKPDSMPTYKIVKWAKYYKAQAECNKEFGGGYLSSGPVFYYDHKSDIFLFEKINNNQDLLISYNSRDQFFLFGQGAIIIKNFVNGSLGITLPSTSSLNFASATLGYTVGDMTSQSLECPQAMPWQVYGLEGDDNFIFYLGGAPCTMIGNLYGSKNYTAQVAVFPTYTNSNFTILGYKYGDLLDFSQVNINLDDIWYSMVDNSTSIFTLFSNFTITLPYSLGNVFFTLDRENVIDAADYYNITIPLALNIDYTYGEDYLESLTCFLSTYNITKSDSSTWFEVVGTTPITSLGVGDANGDGICDILSTNNANTLYVVYGNTTLPQQVSLSDLSLATGYYIINDKISSNTIGIGYIGDVNGDNITDIFAGSANLSPAISFGFVYFGTSSQVQLTKYTSYLNGVNGFMISGTASIGGSTKSPGDINGDGIADIVTGAAGTAYVIFGGHIGVPYNFNPSTLNGNNGFIFTKSNPSQQSNFGISATFIGDINNDGITDLAVSDTSAQNGNGEVYVLFGARSFTATMSTANLNGTNGFIVTGTSSQGYFGTLSTGTGDFNGDGINDLIAAASNGGTSNAGQITIFFGGRSNYITNFNSENGIIIEGNPGDMLGSQLAFADINNDGVAEIIASASDKVQIFFGTALQGWEPLSYTSTLTNCQMVTIYPLVSGNNFGKSISIGDVNNGGTVDLIIGDNNSVYVLYGETFFG